MARGQENVAKVALLFVAVAALNALRRGDLKQWAGAKFLNWNSPAPAGQGTFASTVKGPLATALPDAIASAGAGAGAAASSSAIEAGLVQVGSTKMSKRFADRWRPLAAAAAADGIILTGGAWRSPAEQWRLRVAHCPDPVNSPASACHPPTAKVGSSRHETGDAIDVHLTGSGGRRSPEYLWLAKNAARWNVHNLASEPWHWSIDGK